MASQKKEVQNKLLMIAEVVESLLDETWMVLGLRTVIGKARRRARLDLADCSPQGVAYLLELSHSGSQLSIL